jgi:hypothetical protein
MLDPADEVTVLLQNVKNYLSSDTVSHPRRPKLHNTGVKSSSLRKQVVWLSLIIVKVVSVTVL